MGLFNLIDLPVEGNILSGINIIQRKFVELLSFQALQTSLPQDRKEIVSNRICVWTSAVINKQKL